MPGQGGVGEQVEQDRSFVGLGAGQRGTDRQPVQGAQQVQSQAPEAAGVGGAVAVLGEHRPLRPASFSSVVENWVANEVAEQARQANPLSVGPSEFEELRRLRRENEELRMEKEVLRKAAAYFAQETFLLSGRKVLLAQNST